MSWDYKRGKGPYFYKSVREGDRVRKIYLGRGQKAQAAAQKIELRRKEIKASRDRRLNDIAQAQTAEQHLRELENLTDQMVEEALLESGYHKHRGQWRKRVKCPHLS